MNVDAPFLGQQVPHQDQPLVNHRDKGIRALPPCVAIGDLLQDVGPFGESIAADFDVHRKICAHVKWRVNVDQLEAALIFNLLAQWSVLQRGEDEFVIAPDELIGPALSWRPRSPNSNP